MKVYVVIEPPWVRGIYQTWAECKAAVTGVTGARYQAVATREIADAMLSGPGVVLPPGTYAFTDGNTAGGVGIVFVEQGPDGEQLVSETSTSVGEVFGGVGLPGLESSVSVAEALRKLRNVLAELAALYDALRNAPAGSALTIVHDYQGVSKWIEGDWREARIPVVRTIIEACSALRRERQLDVSFQYQPAHQSTWAGRDDYAYWNGRADLLATRGTSDST
jgi:ribonuclease HI